MDAICGDDMNMAIKKQKSAEPTIYIGPTISKWPLKQYTAFVDGILPSYIAEKVENNPDVGLFIISPADITEIEREIADKATMYAQKFAKIEELNKG